MYNAFLTTFIELLDTCWMEEDFYFHLLLKKTKWSVYNVSH